MFELWVQDHGPGLLSYLSSMLKERSDAEDIWQNTFLKVHQSMDRYIDQGQPRAWIYRIAKNCLVDHVRDQSKTPTMVPIEERHTLEHEEPIDSIISNEMKEEFIQAIDQLPEAQKEVYLLRQRSDLTFKEIAEVLDEPQAKVVGRMHLAMKKLKEVLERGK